MLDKVYNIFKFKLLYNLHLGISKLLRDCSFQFFSSDKMTTKLSGAERQRQPLNRMRVSILCGANFLLAANDRGASAAGLHVDFPSKSCFMQFNGRFLNNGVREILERKNYHAVDIILSITDAYIDRATGFQNVASKTGVHRMYADIVSKVVSQNYGQEWSVAILKYFRKDVCAFKHKLVNMFSPFAHPDSLQ